MANSTRKITGSKKNGYPQYPKTIVEAIEWEAKRKKLEEVLNDLQDRLDTTENAVKAVEQAEASSIVTITGIPSTGATRQQLSAVGLTRDVILDICKGKVNKVSVVTSGGAKFLLVTYANYDYGGSYQCCCSYDYYSTSDSAVVHSGFTISDDGENTNYVKFGNP